MTSDDAGRLTIEVARARYFEANGLVDGGYDAPFVHFRVGPIPLAFPNTKGRVRAVRMHHLGSRTRAAEHEESTMSERQVIERIWKAPIDLVWELWTTAEGIASWFGPKGWTVEVQEIDLHPGGAFRYTMQGSDPDAPARVVASTVTEVAPPNTFVYDSPMGPETMTTAVEFAETSEGPSRGSRRSQPSRGVPHPARRSCRRRRLRVPRRSTGASDRDR